MVGRTEHTLVEYEVLLFFLNLKVKFTEQTFFVEIDMIKLIDLVYFLIKAVLFPEQI